MKAEIKIFINKKHPYMAHYVAEGQVWFAPPDGSSIYGKLFLGSRLLIFPPNGKNITVGWSNTNVDEAGIWLHSYRTVQGWEL
jgi:hypothetical protein